MNRRVERLLSALAVVMVDERPDLLIKVHDVINDKKDGYPYDFKAQVESFRSFFGWHKDTRIA
jgi:hypothetical protein